ncbi:fumarylacetoacetate hydrolase family protein [Halobacillus rhizosphaerae]|uniref:fumarylacetoacetate hydrolase family protein n=1 Tax=Halobacillus rhizosphaerae TaxID=3064889 RepID=UPI00398B1D32
MKTGRVAFEGVIHTVTETSRGIQLANGQIAAEEEVVWLTPIEPETCFALGLNYFDHASELSFQAPEEPLIFLKGPNTFIGHRGKTLRPSEVKNMHYECELAVIIGRLARNVNREDAYDYISGYTIANDYAVRDYLENYYRPNLKAKNRDHSTPLGPWVVEAADIKDPMNLSLRTYVNGEIVQEGSTKDLIFSVPVLIEYISSFMTLNPGDLILTGTPKGTIDTKAGDEVITEIEGIGRLINTITGEATE